MAPRPEGYGHVSIVFISIQAPSCARGRFGSALLGPTPQEINSRTLQAVQLQSHARRGPRGGRSQTRTTPLLRCTSLSFSICCCLAVLPIARSTSQGRRWRAASRRGQSAQRGALVGGLPEPATTSGMCGPLSACTWIETYDRQSLSTRHACIHMCMYVSSKPRLRTAGERLYKGAT